MRNHLEREWNGRGEDALEWESQRTSPTDVSGTVKGTGKRRDQRRQSDGAVFF
jgi:hypothetical protein